jgi:uncharacterized membrane protein
MNDLLQVFLFAMTPICEITGSIPMGIAAFKLPAWQVFLVSLLGNSLIPIFILNFLEIITEFLSKHFAFFKKIINWLFERTRKQYTKNFEIYKSLALFMIAVLPFPFAGTWTASLCAFLFNVPFKRAVFLIFAGNSIAALVLTLVTLGIINVHI